MPNERPLAEISGSHRELVPGSVLVGDPDPAERISVTVLVRRPPGVPPPSEAQPLTYDEFESIHGAAPPDAAAVESFARSHDLDVTAVSRAARTIRLEGSVRRMSEAFGTRLRLYQAGDLSYRGRSGPVFVPVSLAGIVEGVFGLDDRPPARVHLRRLDGESQAHAGSGGPPFTSPQVAALYGFPAGVTGAGQAIGFVELGGGFAGTDLAAYYQQLGLAAPVVQVVSVDGGQNNPAPANNSAKNPDFEVSLDMEIAGAVAPGAAQVVYFAPNTTQGFLDAVNAAVHDAVNQPSVVSISWGGPESALPAQFRTAMENALTNAASLGVTVAVASGDNGSMDQVLDGRLHVDFPASAPHALGVGGTTLKASASATIASEVVWNNATGATGGGVSDAFPLPTWQIGAGVPPSPNPGAFTGRGVPDVAADADPRTGYQIFAHGRAWSFAGTSAAAPLWAGLVALANQKLGRRVGFLNPALYALSPFLAAFRDIVNGNNDNSGASPPLPFASGPGWDACTGLGSPNGTALTLALAGFGVSIEWNKTSVA